MYTCINCGTQVEELYRRYSPTVLKVSKCESCKEIADKYIEYDPVIVLVDLVLLDKPAYRHLLYNSEFNAYWKLLIVLILGESFRKWSSYENEFRLANSNNASIPTPCDNLNFALFDQTNSVFIFQGERIFYYLLVHTTVTLAVFVGVVLLATEIKWALLSRPIRYKKVDLIKGLIIGGCAKLLGLLSVIWHHISPEPHQILIYGYTGLCLLTAYSVVCESGRTGSFIVLACGFLAYTYVYTSIPDLCSSTTNMTLLQT